MKYYLDTFKVMRETYHSDNKVQMIKAFLQDEQREGGKEMKGIKSAIMDLAETTNSNYAVDAINPREDGFTVNLSLDPFSEDPIPVKLTYKLSIEFEDIKADTKWLENSLY